MIQPCQNYFRQIKMVRDAMKVIAAVTNDTFDKKETCSNLHLRIKHVLAVIVGDSNANDTILLRECKKI